MATNLYRIDDRQRRARLARRHHLAGSARATDLVTIAGDLVGLHGSDPASVFLSAWARLRKPATAVASLEASLYEHRTLVRTLCMRRTMFVVPTGLVPVVQAAVTEALVPGERRRTVQMIEQGSITTDGTTFLAALEEATLAELRQRRQDVGRHHRAFDPGAVPALHRPADRAGSPQRLMDQQPVPVVADRGLAAGRGAGPRPRTTSNGRRAGPSARPGPPWSPSTPSRSRSRRARAGSSPTMPNPYGRRRRGWRCCPVAAELEQWLGPMRITPRFPTPLQKALVAEDATQRGA